MAYANCNTTHGFNRSAYKMQKPHEPKTKSQAKPNDQKPKAKEAKAKSEAGMQMKDFLSR